MFRAINETYCYKLLANNTSIYLFIYLFLLQYEAMDKPGSCPLLCWEEFEFLAYIDPKWVHFFQQDVKRVVHFFLQDVLAR